MGINEQDREIADRIQKLIAKAESTDHDAEADAFQSKAEELMRKHSLTRADLELADFVAVNWEPGYSQAPGWYKALVANIGGFLGVFTGYDSMGKGQNCILMLGGRQRDIDMLQYMAEAIKAQIESLAVDFRERTNASRAEVNSYRVGVAQRVGEKLQAMVENVSDGQAEKGLVLVDENREKTRKGKQAVKSDTGARFRKGDTASYQSESARRRGVQDGEKVNVHKGTTSGESTKQITS